MEEIYGIHLSGKYHDLKRTYNELYHIYDVNDYKGKILPRRIIIEDSNSGYQFFKFLCDRVGIECLSAKGKSNIKGLLESMEHENTLVIADGAAIGAEMRGLYGFLKDNSGVRLYLPESFEWIILKSGLIDGNTVQEILEAPEEHIDSSKYFSWERYFTNLLIDYTNGTYMQYNEAKMSPSSTVCVNGRNIL